MSDFRVYINELTIINSYVLCPNAVGFILFLERLSTNFSNGFIGKIYLGIKQLLFLQTIFSLKKFYSPSTSGSLRKWDFLLTILLNKLKIEYVILILTLHQ